MGKPTSCENWGLGLLFVFFPDELIVTRTQIFRRSSNPNPILSKAQFTISICFVLVCVTFLLFTLSTFEPSARKPKIAPSSSRRLMSEKSEPRPKSNSRSKSNPSSSFWVRSKLRERSDYVSERRRRRGVSEMGGGYESFESSDEDEGAFQSSDALSW